MVLRGQTRITRKGQITIPVAIREALRLHGGENLSVTYDEATRQVTIEDARSVVQRTAGMFKPAHPPVETDIHELVAGEKREAREGMMQAALERDRRSRGF